MYPAVRTETECLVYIPVTCVTSHIHPERKREKEKTYLHDPKPSRFVIHLFSPIITREREREGTFFLVVVCRDSQYLLVQRESIWAWNTQLAAIYTHTHDDFFADDFQ